MNVHGQAEHDAAAEANDKHGLSRLSRAKKRIILEKKIGKERHNAYSTRKAAGMKLTATLADPVV